MAKPDQTRVAQDRCLFNRITRLEAGMSLAYYRQINVTRVSTQLVRYNLVYSPLRSVDHISSIY